MSEKKEPTLSDIIKAGADALQKTAEALFNSTDVREYFRSLYPDASSIDDQMTPEGEPIREQPKEDEKAPGVMDHIFKPSGLKNTCSHAYSDNGGQTFSFCGLGIEQHLNWQHTPEEETAKVDEDAVGDWNLSIAPGSLTMIKSDQKFLPPLPTHLKVGHKTYSIFYDEESWERKMQAGHIDRDDPQWALTRHMEGEIFIRPNISIAETRDCLWHEMMHCCFHASNGNIYSIKHTNMDIEEYAVAAVTNWMVGVIRDNPDFRNFISMGE